MIIQLVFFKQLKINIISKKMTIKSKYYQTNKRKFKGYLVITNNKKHSKINLKKHKNCNPLKMQIKYKIVKIVT